MNYDSASDELEDVDFSEDSQSEEDIVSEDDSLEEEEEENDDNSEKKLTKRQLQKNNNSKVVIQTIDKPKNGRVKIDDNLFYCLSSGKGAAVTS